MTDDRPSLGTLVAGITAEFSALVRGEIALAKAEMRESAKAGAAGAILFVIAGVLLAMVWLLVTWAVVYVLVEVADLPTWASFLIVAGFYLLVAIILGAVGAFRLKKARGPEQAKAELERTKQIIESLPPNMPPVPEDVRNPNAAKARHEGMSRPSDIALEGPWTHRTISARGARFHLAEAGDGPLVLLLHGFPEFWWTWRHQLPALAEAGYRAVAMDLRGFGGSDHTPRGYDLPSLAGDVDSVIASLGVRDAIIVGHDWGGLVGWTLASYEPKAVRRLVAVSAPHPLRLRSSLVRRPDLTRQLWGMQAPWLPERAWSGAGTSRVDATLHQWAAPGWPDLPTSLTYRKAFALGNTAYCAAEYHRWFVRSMVRLDGARFRRRLQTPVGAPVLQVHGAADSCFPPDFAQGSGRHVVGPYRWRLMEGVGHFPHEEAPERFTDELLHWLADEELTASAYGQGPVLTALVAEMPDATADATWREVMA